MNNFNQLRFHISGSAGQNVSNEILQISHKFIYNLVIEILKQNGQMTVTFGNEPTKQGLSLIYDYTIMEAIVDFYSQYIQKESLIVKSILYNSYESKIPTNRKTLYNTFKNFDSIILKVLSYLRSHGGNLRNEITKNSDILIVLGGLKGVYNLIEIFNSKKKIIIPLNIDIENTATFNCIDMLKNEAINLYSPNISDKIITRINKFCLNDETDIQDLIHDTLDTAYLLVIEKGEEIVDIILRDLKSLQQKNRAVHPEENKYTTILVEFMRRSLKEFGYTIYTQEPSGKTPKGYNNEVIRGGMGELDIRIVDENNDLIHICEAFILTYLNSTVIENHLNKIFDYDANGLQLNFIFVYSKTENFFSLWKKYLQFLQDYNWRYPLIESEIKDLSEARSCPAEIKITLTKHNRKGINCMIYHIFTNLK